MMVEVTIPEASVERVQVVLPQASKRTCPEEAERVTPVLARGVVPSAARAFTAKGAGAGTWAKMVPEVAERRMSSGWGAS
jgi:hypothetical protein